ncbi:MAG TPA: hypothetical protein VJ729_12780 [Nitrososphaeraceae archaeon]|nr:hypothetical protein [Nitrososphaeraceae archaeon]
MNSKTSLTLGLTAVLTLGMIIMLASPLSATTTIRGNGVMTNPNQNNNVILPGVYASGNIASLQNDKDGKPTWLLSGSWRGSLTNITSAMSSNANNTASKKNLPIATFNAVFSMVMLNGSALHRHQISNFSLTDMSIPNNGIILYNGTASITMKEGPVNDVPLSIKTLNDNVISIWIDPAKTMNHFGNTPIYGTIIRDVVIRK